MRYNDIEEHYNKIADRMMQTNFSDRDLVSGVDLKADIATFSKSEMGGDPPRGTFDHQSTLNAVGNVYYARSMSWVLQNSSKAGQDITSREVTAESYIIMPKKFDAEVAIDMHFSNDSDSQAKMKTKFMYDNEVYEFITNTSINGEEELNLLLYPYCPLFDGLDLDYENSYIDQISEDDFNYEGTFVIRAVQAEG